MEQGSSQHLKCYLHILDKPEQFNAVEQLQRRVWPGSDLEVVPDNVMIAASHSGGLVIGAYDGGTSNTGEPDGSQSLPFDHSAPDSELIGFVFGFPGLYFTPDGPRPKHCSHMLGVLPAYRDMGIGFLLKRAQWQMVRHQGLDRITWTYDPLQSRNAYLNIARLGAVSSNYLVNYYGAMRDGLNAGIPSDRFVVDWWINSPRVNRRLSKRARPRLDLAHFLAAGTTIVNAATLAGDGLPRPSKNVSTAEIEDGMAPAAEAAPDAAARLLLVEIPADFHAVRAASLDLALEWRMHVRWLFERLFASGYLVTDFVHLPGKLPRSYYVLSHGESTL